MPWSREIMEVHHQKNHKVYVTNLHLCNEHYPTGRCHQVLPRWQHQPLNLPERLLARDQSDSLAKLKNGLERDLHGLEIIKKQTKAAAVAVEGLSWATRRRNLFGYCLPKPGPAGGHHYSEPTWWPNFADSIWDVGNLKDVSERFMFWSVETQSFGLNCYCTIRVGMKSRNIVFFLEVKIK